jgi:hypothetical protein
VRLAWRGLLRGPLERQNGPAGSLSGIACQASSNSRSKATACPPLSDGGVSISTASDAIYRARQAWPQCPLIPRERRYSGHGGTSHLCHKRKSIGADVDLYARPVDGRRTRAISQSGIAHNAVCRINRRSA